MEDKPRQPSRRPRLDKVGRGRWTSLAVVGTALLIVALWLYVQPDTATEKKGENRAGLSPSTTRPRRREACDENTSCHYG